MAVVNPILASTIGEIKVNIFDNHAVSSSSETTEQRGSTPTGEVTGGALDPLLSNLIQNPATPLFPQLSQVFGSLFDAIQPGQQLTSQTSSPFSPAAAGISPELFNSPGQLVELLGNASQKLSNGLAGGQLTDQETLLKMQAAVEQASTLMNIRGQK